MALLVGTSGNDVLAGIAEADEIRSLGGDDRLEGGCGNDQLFGGSGNDQLDCADAGAACRTPQHPCREDESLLRSAVQLPGDRSAWTGAATGQLREGKVSISRNSDISWLSRLMGSRVPPPRPAASSRRRGRYRLPG
ncbi:hypothetical protein IBL26_22085 [Roseomonas aerophila]|uniref:Uncharacterized protein n=1 Tax=Teichococcus aerophilus TaxID=1224513 RepID=A0ABR7RSF1_9PROT|nr:hypothetical protein [Pseudoroseomonas aerophila]